MTPRLVALSILVGGALAGASATFPVGDGDMYWHLANAQHSLQQGLVRTDLFSWTAPGVPVPVDQWLGDLLLYAGYIAAGWPGVVAVRTIAVAVVIGAIALAAFLRRPGAPVVALAVALPAIVLSRVLWVERPELLGAACFAVLVLLLQFPGERPLIATAPLLVLWANLHGSFALGSGLVLLVAAYGMWREPSLRRGHVIAALGALLALVATPAGLGTLSTPGTHLLSPPREIQEWAIPDPTSPPGAVWLLVLALTLVTASISGGARVRDVLVIVPLALVSLVAIRHTPLFAIAATPYLAEQLPLAFRLLTRTAIPPAEGPRERGGPPDRRRLAVRHGPPPSQAAGGRVVVPRELRGFRRAGEPFAIVIPMAVGIALMIAGIAIAPREPDESAFPVAALDALPRGPGLLAEYDWGGWLIWRAPGTPVFIDGRLAPYRSGTHPTVLEDYRTVVEAAQGWRDVLDHRGVRWLLVRPADPVAVRALDLGWPVLSRSPGYVLISVIHRSP